MKFQSKARAGVAFAAALVVGGFGIAQAASAALAPPVKNQPYGATVFPRPIDADCTGQPVLGPITNDVFVSVHSKNDPDAPVVNAGNYAKFRVTWAPGSGSITLTKAVPKKKIPASALFPCGEPSTRFRFQPLDANDNPVGQVRYRRIGVNAIPPSG